MTELIDRKEIIRTERQAETFIRQRLQQAADLYGDKVDAAMRVELCNEVLAKFITKIYTRDAAGAWVHVDAITYRILAPKPWGSSGWKYAGLRQWEARILSKILISRMQTRQFTALFDYNTETREWYLNVGAYRSLDIAMGYLQAKPITLGEWQKAIKTYVKTYVKR